MRSSKIRIWVQANQTKIKMKVRAFRVMIQLQEADFHKHAHHQIVIDKIRAE